MEKLRVREDVLKIKALISEPRNLKIRNEAEEYLTQLHELGFRIEELEKKLESKDTGVSYKRKKQIISILRNGKKTSTEVGRILKISRTRSSEYLNVLEKEGIVVSVRVDRKKYYSLKGD